MDAATKAGYRGLMHTVFSHPSLVVLLCSVLVGCPSDPGPLDAPFTEDTAFVTDDAFTQGEDATFDSCPVPQAGRWVIGRFTYTGPDCVSDWTIDTEYHPVAFVVDATGNVTDCQCDTAGDVCEVLIASSRRPPCTARIACRGNSLDVDFESSTSGIVREHRLASRVGYCFGTGPFTPG